MTLKRLFDVTASGLGLILLAIPLGVIAIAVRATSPGPVLFRQVRAGKGGEGFVIYKFRTMEHRGETQVESFDAGDTSRVTPLGRFLRSAKLDELPQLWNVLKGDMSLVGPRPEVRRWVDEFPERWHEIHQVRPGITDPASIVFRNEEEILARADDPERIYREEILPRKLDLYEEYVRSQSFWGDIYIIFMTFKAIFGQRAEVTSREQNR